MHDFIMVEDSELWDVICGGPYVPTKVLEELPFSMLKTRKEYTDTYMKVVEKNFRAKKILVCGIGPDENNRISTCDTAKEIWDALQIANEGTTQVKQSKIDMLTTEYEIFRIKDDESIQDIHTRFTSIINELHSLGKTIPRNKLVRKILSILPSSWESNVNAITEAKELQELTIDELVGNLKTYEMKRKIDSERRESKKEKNLVLKADSNDSSGEDSDMAYLTKRFQKMVKRNGGMLKRGSSSKPKNYDLCHKCGKLGTLSKTAITVWGDSSSESEDETDACDSSMMAVESEKNEYDSTFALMAQSDDDEDDDNSEGIMKGRGQKWLMDSGCSKHMTGNTMDFLSLKALRGGSVSIGNGKKGYILGVGKSRKSLTHSIENMYYVNDLRYSLLSVSQICDKGNKVEFLSKIFIVTNLVTGKVVLVAKRYKNIYVTDFESLQSGDLSCLKVVDDDAKP
ncbi:uncharacterized protein [Nicotiana sylvestris]|uniref:uncharacterized protein n=1 Tax=Nicotiana sylvestris TaxID=4096 RepID=UPI00388C387E